MRTPATVLLAALAASMLAGASAQPDLVAFIHAIRAQGCADRPGVKPALRPDARLDRVAAALGSGTSLRQAMLDAGYRAVQSATLEAAGSDASMARALAERACDDILNPLYRDFGIALAAGKAWVVLAAPQDLPTAGEAHAVNLRVLELVNEARARPRRCGWKRFGTAAPLLQSDSLQRAALAHASDMARRSTLSHTGSDGSTPAERATRAGYRWRVVGENIAARQSTPEQVVAAWLDSPRHCANLMSTEFTEMGAAFVAEPDSEAGIYWSQMFGSPRAAN